MNCKRYYKIFIGIIFFNCTTVIAQDSTSTCKVELRALKGVYAGECKNGWAHGKGEARGMHHYIGVFKWGLPNGKGTYYYSDSEYYIGNFQEGIREGKGEMHYLENGKPDSIVKGYWSADEYRGKSYKTYEISDISFFDNVELEPSERSGNTITVETTATTQLFTVGEISATDGGFIKPLKTFTTLFKSTTTYELSKFPIRLMIYFSNGMRAQIELYKKADWNMKLYLNK